jgi:hypothetical protein
MLSSIEWIDARQEAPACVRARPVADELREGDRITAPFCFSALGLLASGSLNKTTVFESRYTIQALRRRHRISRYRLREVRVSFPSARKRHRIGM